MFRFFYKVGCLSDYNKKWDGEGKGIVNREVPLHKEFYAWVCLGLRDPALTIGAWINIFFKDLGKMQVKSWPQGLSNKF